jgi:hypothetical protein
MSLTKHTKQTEQKIYGVYIPSILNKKVVLSINEIGKQVKQNLEKTISKNMEGRCIKEGFIQNGSVKVLSYSSGTINGEKIEFQKVRDELIMQFISFNHIESNWKPGGEVPPPNPLFADENLEQTKWKKPSKTVSERSIYVAFYYDSLTETPPETINFITSALGISSICTFSFGTSINSPEKA